MGSQIVLEDSNNHKVAITPKDGATGDRTVILPDDIEKAHIHKGDFTGDIDTLFGADAVGIYGMVSGSTTCTSGLPIQSDGTQDSGNGVMEVFHQVNGVTIQVIHNSFGSSFTFKRQYSGGSWQGWKYYGSLTGSNANGEYIKHADGTLICTYLSSGTYTPNLAHGAAYYININLTFPATFVGTVRATAESVDVSGITFASLYGTLDGTNINIRMISFINTSYGKVMYTAIGRWRA